MWTETQVWLRHLRPAGRWATGPSQASCLGPRDAPQAPAPAGTHGPPSACPFPPWPRHLSGPTRGLISGCCPRRPSDQRRDKSELYVGRSSAHRREGAHLTGQPGWAGGSRPGWLAGFPPQPHRVLPSAPETMWPCPVVPAGWSYRACVTRACPLGSFRQARGREPGAVLSVRATGPCFAPGDLGLQRAGRAGGRDGHRQPRRLTPAPAPAVPPPLLLGSCATTGPAERWPGFSGVRLGFRSGQPDESSSITC